MRSVFDDLMIMLDCFLPSYAHAALSLSCVTSSVDMSTSACLDVSGLVWPAHMFLLTQESGEKSHVVGNKVKAIRESENQMIRSFAKR
jgi:hypothetical protein